LELVLKRRHSVLLPLTYLVIYKSFFHCPHFFFLASLIIIIIIIIIKARVKNP